MLAKNWSCPLGAVLFLLPGSKSFGRAWQTRGRGIRFSFPALLPGCPALTLCNSEMAQKAVEKAVEEE